MKRSDLNKFIKENIIETLSESSSSEEKRIALRAVNSIAKYRDVSHEEAKQDLLRAIDELGDLKESDIIREEEANIGLADLQDIGYDDGEYAFDKHFNKSQLNNRLDTKYYTRGFVQAITDSAESLRLNEEADDDDVDAKAIKAAKGARGKHKKLDLAIKALKSISTEMKSLARKYSAGDEAEKERIKDILRTKTPQKKELESLVAKLEKDVV